MKNSTPLSRAITTAEGILVIAADFVVGGCAAIDPHLLSPHLAAILIVVQHVALLAQRGALKAVAITKGLGPDPLGALESLVLDSDPAPADTTAPPTPQS